MKLFIFLSAFVALAAADNFLSAKLERALVPPQSEVLINGTFEVPQDHFNPTNGRRLKFVRIFNQTPISWENVQIVLSIAVLHRQRSLLP